MLTVMLVVAALNACGGAGCGRLWIVETESYWLLEFEKRKETTDDWLVERKQAVIGDI
jgi:hypothetical protein